MRRLLTIPTAALALMAAALPASAAEIKALVTIAMQSTVEELGPKFEAVTGHKLVATYALSPAIAKRLEDGEAFDFVVSTRGGIDALLKSGKVTAGADGVLMRSSIAVGIRKGAPKPDIATPDALKQSLLAAKSISYSDPAAGGPSGVHFAKVLERLGIFDAMKAKTKFPPPGGFVGVLVASGEAEIGIQQTGELMTIPGVEVVGLLPKDLQNVTVYVGAVPAAAREPAAAVAFLRFLQSPEAATVMKARGLEPGAS